MKGKKLLTLFLAAITLFSVTACKDDNKSSDTDSSSGVKVTGNFIVENARSDYKILVPANAQKKENIAAEELQSFFEEATDVRLDIVKDTGVSYSDSAKYFSIGETTIAKELNIVATDIELGQQGFIQKTVGNSMVFLGSTQYGTLYSVYDYLEEEFHYNYFNANAYYIDKQVKNVPLRAYDETEKPDIGSLAPNYGAMAVGDEANVHDRYRMTSREFTAMKINGATSVHNMLLILPIESYGEEHPDWYTNWTEDPNYPYEENLCLTAHGNAEEYAKLVDAFCAQIYEEFLAGSTGKLLIFGQMDGAPACECDTCKANTKKYGAESSSAILFLNDVLDKVYAWFETEEGKPYKRDFYINILAYQTYENAPVTYHKETDSFTVNEGLKIHNKIGYVMAPIKYDFGMPSTDTKNAPMYLNMRAWSSIGNSCMYYTYDFHTRFTIPPYESMTAKQELYKLMKEANCLHLYDQGQWLNPGLATGWSLLKIYVASKLRWNVDLDVNQLIYDYFYGVYGPAGEIMYNMYWSYRTYWTEIREKAKKGEDGIQDKWVNYISGYFVQKEVWDYPLLTGWLEQYEQAFALIEPLKKSNPSQYKGLERNLCAERVSTLYLLLYLYNDRYTKLEQEELISMLEYDSNLTKISLLSESTGSIEEFIAGIRAKA